MVAFYRYVTHPSEILNYTRIFKHQANLESLKSTTHLCVSTRLIATFQLDVAVGTYAKKHEYVHKHTHIETLLSYMNSSLFSLQHMITKLAA